MFRFATLIVLLLAGCKEVPLLPHFGPYKIDIQQGNHVTQEMVAKLRPGMSRAQVRYALGTPLVVDPFRTDRWDYVYVYQRGSEVLEQRRIVVVFQDEKLLRIEGDVVPAARAAESRDPPPGIPPREPAGPASPTVKPAP